MLERWRNRGTVFRTAAFTVMPVGRKRVRGLAKGVAAVGLTSLLVTTAVTATAEDAASNQSRDPAVISEWNQIAQATLTANTATSVPEDILYMGFVQAAVYNAVVGIEGRYEPYRFPARAPKASSQAAAAAAAYKILLTYSPDAQHAGLDSAYAQSLAKVPDGKAKTAGVKFGQMAASALIAQRADDGRNDAKILFTKQPAAGVWRPTAAGTSFLVPWLGFVDPLLVKSGAQFGKPGPPPALTSDAYTTEFNEVKNKGSKNSTTRDAQETATALFYSGNAFVQFNTALRDQAMVRKLDIVDAARMFAAVDMSVADGIISVWRSKYDYAFWRPITAVQLADTDGNPATTADPSWEPYLGTMPATPPYPDYVSGYCGVTGAFTRALQGAVQTQHLQLTFTSTAVPNTTRVYDSASEVRNEVIDARVWLGIHFRTADVRGVQMGDQVAEWALGHYFRPVA